MKRQLALFACATLLTWLTDLSGTWLFADNPTFGNWAYLTLAVPAAICWVIGFRPRRAKDVLLYGVIGGIGSGVYIAATWRMWPEADGKVPQDAAGVFELVALLIVWLTVMSFGALLSHLLTDRRERTA